MCRPFLIFILFISSFQFLNAQIEGVECKNVDVGADVLIDNDHKIWFIDRYKGISFVVDTVLTNYNEANSPLPSNVLQDIALESGRIIWAATAKGLVRIEDNNFQIYDSANSPIPANFINTVAAEPGKVIIGTNYGIAILENNKWKIFTTGNSNLLNDTISKVHIKKGTYWMVSKKGLNLLKENKWESFTSANTGIQMEWIGHIKSSMSNTYFSIKKDIYKYGRKGFEKVHLDLLSNFKISGSPSTLRFDVNKNDDLYLKGTVSTSDHLFKKYTTIIRYDQNYGDHTYFILKEDYNTLSFMTLSPDEKYVFTIGCKLDLKKSNVIEPFITHKNFKFLDINNARAPVNPYGSSDLSFIDEHYKVPFTEDGNAPANFYIWFWIAGKDVAGNHYASLGTSYTDISDLSPGPLKIQDGSAAPEKAEPYNKVWKVNKSDVQLFNAYFNGDTACFNFEVPSDILTWPGNGLPGYADQLAPFVDADNDGIYNPSKGDYPDIKGDQMLWSISNDTRRDSVTASGSLIPMQLEIQQFAYAYSCPLVADTLQVLNNTTFHKYKVTNRSDKAYKDVYIGLVTEMKIGETYSGSYLATAPEGNFAYLYNKVPDPKYGIAPIINLVILNGPEAKVNDGIDNNNNGIVDELGEKALMTFARPNSQWCSNPTSWNTNYYPEKYYLYLSGKRRDGSPMLQRYLGCRIDTNETSPEFRHVFDGIPFTNTGWTDNNEYFSTHKGVTISAGPFDIAPGETKEFEYAIILSWDTTGPNGLHTSIATNNRDVMQVKKWYEQNNFPDCANKVDPELFKKDAPAEVNIFPNPTSGDLTIHYRRQTENGYFMIYDLRGRYRFGKQLDCCGRTGLNTSSLDAGTYFIRIIDGNNVVIKRFIKVP